MTKVVVGSDEDVHNELLQEVPPHGFSGHKGRCHHISGLDKRNPPSRQGFSAVVDVFHAIEALIGLFNGPEACFPTSCSPRPFLNHTHAVRLMVDFLGAIETMGKELGWI